MTRDFIRNAVLNMLRPEMEFVDSGMSFAEMEAVAEDRASWRTMVDGLI